MPDPLLGAVIGLCGLLLGVLLKFLFDHLLEYRKAELKRAFDVSAEAERAFRQARAACYADFQKAFADIAIAQQNDDTIKARDGMARILDAKARMVIYGSPAVLSALAEVIRHGGVMESADDYERFVALCNLMRHDADPTQPAAPAGSIRMVLFSR